MKGNFGQLLILMPLLHLRAFLGLLLGSRLPQESTMCSCLGISHASSMNMDRHACISAYSIGKDSWRIRVLVDISHQAINIDTSDRERILIGMRFYQCPIHFSRVGHLLHREGWEGGGQSLGIRNGVNQICGR